jgi:sugar phosphate isomerase/epimerase
MTPRFAVSEFTTPALSFADDLAVYREAGADGIGISETKLGDDRADLERLRRSGLAASSFFPSAGTVLPTPMVPGQDEPEARVDTIAAGIRRLAAFRPDCCLISTGPRGRYDRDEAFAIVVDGVRRLAQEAEDEGMRLAVELMHPSLGDLFSFMTSIPCAVGLIDAVSHPNVGIALDCWHLSDDPEVLEQVREHAKMVAAVHLNDRRAPTRSWCDRVLPGDGVIDFPAVLGALDDGGFEGWFELEVVSDDGSVEHDFPDSLWKWDPLELVSRGRAQFLSLWERRQRKDEPAR